MYYVHLLSNIINIKIILENKIHTKPTIKNIFVCTQLEPAISMMPLNKLPAVRAAIPEL